MEAIHCNVMSMLGGYHRTGAGLNTDLLQIRKFELVIFALLNAMAKLRHL